MDNPGQLFDRFHTVKIQHPEDWSDCDLTLDLYDLQGVIDNHEGRVEINLHGTWYTTYDTNAQIWIESWKRVLHDVATTPKPVKITAGRISTTAAKA